MARYEVKYTHVVERKVTALVEADSPTEAIEKAQAGDTIADDEQDCPEDGIETKDYEATEVEED